jgi:uncharacterized protein YbjQ (UPF0145 family)
LQKYSFFLTCLCKNAPGSGEGRGTLKRREPGESAKQKAIPYLPKKQVMLVTTTPTIEGQPIRNYIGIVTAEAIIGANIVKDLFAGIRDIVGGRSGTYERVIEEARMNALRELEEKAAQMGANAVVGVDLDFETVGSGGSMLMVVATGTAVQI